MFTSLAQYNDAHVWVAISVVVFIVLMWKPVGKLVLNALDSRADKIRKELDDAEILVAEADRVLEQYKRQQIDAKAEAEALLKKAREEAEDIRRRAMEEVEIALKNREKHAMDRIAQAQAAAMHDIRTATVTLAMAAARKVINDNLDDDAAEQLMHDAMSHIGRKVH